MFSRKNVSSRNSALPLFKDLAPGTWDRLPPYTIGTDSLLSPRKTGNYIYIITHEHKLEVMPAEDEHGFPNHHATMAFRSPVYAAGEMRFENGKCVINNQSGGFQPKGQHLKSYVLEVVSKHGIRNAEFHYIHESEHLDMNNPPENMILLKEHKSQNDVTMSDSTHFLGVFFTEGVPQPHISYLYRGDSRGPEQIFSKGFTARGTRANILEHVNGICGESVVDSSYIATSTSKQVASEFPKDFAGKGFVYEIVAPKDAIHVETALMPYVGRGQLDVETWEMYRHEQEMAIPNKIKARSIRGVWPAEITMVQIEDGLVPDFERVSVVQDEFIPNPSYSAPGGRLLKTIKIAGYSATTIAAVMDANSLWNAYQTSQQSGNYDAFFIESARITGGWGGAIALGKASAAVCAPVPYGSLVCGVAGSVLGYIGGSELAKMNYSKSLTHPDEVYTIGACDMPIQANQAGVLGSKISSAIDSVDDMLSQVRTGLSEYSEKTSKINTLSDALRAINPSQNELGEEQNPARMTCTKDRLSHRFVTPHYVSMRELEKQTTNGIFLYVMSEKEKLVIAKKEGLLFGESVSHIDLARGKPVYAAGMIKVEQGKIVSIDNRTTDYQYKDNAIRPSNEALIHMFNTNGMSDIQNKWVHAVLPDALTNLQQQPAVTKEEILPPVNLYTTPLLSSASFFTQSTGHQKSLTRKALLHPSDSSIDFAARKAHFSSLIAKPGVMPLSPKSSDKPHASVHVSSQSSMSKAPSMFRVHHALPQHQSGSAGVLTIEITEPGWVTCPSGKIMSYDEYRLNNKCT